MVSDSTRSNGWYWVREKGDESWIVGRWFGGMQLWAVGGVYLGSRYLAEIDERPITRDDRDHWFALAAKYHEMLTRPTTPPDSGAVDELGTER